MDQPEPPRQDRPTSPLMRRAAALVIPAIVGAGAALGVAAATVGLGGGSTTVIRERSAAVTSAWTSAQEPAAAGNPRPPGGLSVAQIVKRESPAVVLISARTDRGGSLGSGFLIDEEGHVLTNAHVVDGATGTTVTFSDGTEGTARILGVDESADLAVLRIPEVPEDVRPVPLGSSANLVVGQEVVAIGNPYGYERTATTGIVSALKRVIEAPNGFTIQNAIQTDAAINQGNSGGPLFDRGGRVIGINSQIASENGGNVGIGFAVPIDTVRPIARSIIRGGTAEHAWIGITGRELTPALAGTLGLGDRRGVLITEIDARGPARDAGLEAADDPDAAVPRGADLIVAVNDRPVTDMADVSQAVASREVGETIRVTVLRDGQPRTIDLTLEDRPEDVGTR